MNEFLQHQLIIIGNYQLTVLDVLKLLSIFFGTHLLLAGVLGWFRRVVNRKGYDSGRSHSIGLLITYIAWSLALLSMLSVVGIQASVLIASSAALFVGLGFGLQSIFRDIVSGVFLLFEGTIEVDDVLEVDKIVGRVDQIYLRTTNVITRDGVTVIIPNSKILSENVINWTHNNSASVVRLPVIVPYHHDAQAVRTLLQQVLDKKRSAHMTDTEVVVTEFAEKYIKFELLFKTKQVFEVEAIKSELRLDVLSAFTSAGISLAQ
jgi:small-conductance mechanosensitive channel